MKHKVFKSIQCFLLVCLLFVSSFGLVFARYQVSHSEEITFSVRGVSEFIVQNASSEWIMNYETGNLESSFRVHNAIGTNKPNYDLLFNIHVLVDAYVSSDMQLKMVMRDVAGVETVYMSKVLGTSDNKREYTFVDSNGAEVDFVLLDDSTSYLEFDLIAIGADEAFLSEVVIIDGGYDIGAESLDMTAQYIPLEISSNFLSKDSVHNIFVDESVVITMESNMGMDSKISCSTDSTLIIPSIDVSELFLDANSVQGVNLSWTINEEVLSSLTTQTTETISVLWQVIDDRNVIVEEWKGNFLVVVNPLIETEFEQELQQPTVTVDSDKKSFSQYRPIECTVVSNIDTHIGLVEETFLAGTKYSLDGGNSWFVMAKDGMVELDLVANEKINLIIDPVLSAWENKWFNLYTMWDNRAIYTLQFEEKDESLDTLVVSNMKTGIITKQSVSFTINKGIIDSKSSESILIKLEQLQDGKYIEVDKDTYFTWTNEIVDESTKYTLSALEDKTVPSGTYRIRIQQKFSDIIISEEFVAFFVKA